MESFLKYWQEIIERDDSTAMKKEFPIMVNTVGMYRVYKAVIQYIRTEEEE